jgi:hypothetical protein
MATYRCLGSIRLSKMVIYRLDPNGLANHSGSEDDDPEGLKDDWALNAPPLFKLVTNHAMSICSPVRRVRE